MLGWSAENIAKDKTGLVWFPTGPEDPRYSYGFKWVQHRVKAMEAVRAHVEVIVVNERELIKEHTPVEVKVMGYIYDDGALLAYNAGGGAETHYVIGTQAHLADPAVPSPFMTELLWLEPTTPCLVRFEANTRVQHPVPSVIRTRWMKRCREIWVVAQAGALAGTITITALGNEVGI